ncbi:MAG: hypothetical protein WC250_02185 [Candidatus Paceibacterota bacterium]|jgi:hypothetical protein
MEILERLFGHTIKVKLMRLFIFNPDEAFTLEDATHRVKGARDPVRSEIVGLEKTGLVKRTNFIKDVEVRNRKGEKESERRKVAGFTLDKRFRYLSALQNLLLDTSPAVSNQLLKRLKKSGRIKLVAVAGVFVQDYDNRIDLLVVGDRLNRVSIDQTMRTVESEIGRELKYAVLETADFKYRIGVCDKLIRDIFDYQHRILLDNIGVNYK